MGDADLLPKTGNVLAFFPFIENESGFTARLVEFVPQSGELLLDLEFSPRNDADWVGYRAERVDSLYPKGAGVTRSWKER